MAPFGLFRAIDTEMDEAQQKEKFSDAYIHAVTAVAGYGISKPVPDDDSIDWIICARGAGDTPRRPRLEVQLKCSARNVVRATHVHLPLEIKNYDELRIPEARTPCILIVVTVPDDPVEWLTQSEHELAMRHCGYWLSLRGEPGVANTSNVTVRLPRDQIFTPMALQNIMRRINDEGTL